MYGYSFTSKQSSPFSLSSLDLLPVLTLSAWILISRTPVEASVEVKVRAASHFSKVPSMGWKPSRGM